MPDLPTGTLTFLFTDVESSGALWDQQPQALQSMLARQNATLRRAIEEHAGYIFKTAGEAFFAVFVRALDALEAALTAQRDLQAQGSDTAGGGLQVRMALHTGAPEARGDDYFGPALNRVARVLSAGHGGQILLSAATQELVRDQLPPAVGLRDLGRHRLRDLIHPEHIFQVVAPDLPADFAPLHTLDYRPNNLPASSEILIGREHDVAETSALLRRPAIRLVTLVGPGGAGKTRLSLQVAAELLDTFVDGVWFVDLAPIHDAGLVGSTIAHALGIKEAAGQPSADTLKTALRDKQSLIVLDNFEQVMPAAGLVADLLAAAPQLKVLITSREVLRVYGEHEYLVLPLAVPDLKHLPSPEQLSQYAAVELFIQRARALNPEFRIINATAPAIAEICVRLDGLPLAIELAAARSKEFSPRALLARLDHRLALLIGGAESHADRQQTLRGTIDWSFGLLDRDIQRFFSRLSVFVGGCTIEAAETVCTLHDDLPIDVMDGLASLVDKSLLRQEAGPEGEPRFGMLETIHEYARERLEDVAEAALLRRQHAAFFLALAEQAAPELEGRRQGVWLDRLEAELGNFRAALGRRRSTPEDDQIRLRLAASLTILWAKRGYAGEGRAWLEGLLNDRSDSPTAVCAPAYAALGTLAWQQGDYIPARAAHEQALALYQELGDQRGIAAALRNIGAQALNQGDYQQAQMYLEQSLALSQHINDVHGSANSLLNLGLLAREQGDAARALEHYQRSLVLFQTLDDMTGIAVLMHNLGEIAQDSRDLVEAAARYSESLDYFEAAGHIWGIAYTQHKLATLAVATGELARATALLQQALLHMRELGDPRGIAWCLEVLAGIASEQRQPERAASLWGAAASIREHIGVPIPPADEPEHERAIAAARSRLDQEAWDAAWANGQAMPPAQALLFALEQRGN